MILRRGAHAVLVAAVLVGVGCKRGTRDAEGVPSIEVEKVDAFVREIRAEGVLRAVEATPVLAPQDARRPMKVAWLAADGSQVRQGDVVVRFDPAEMQRQLADSQDDVSTEKRKLDKVKVESATARRKRQRTAELADLEATVAKEFETQDKNILSRVEIIEGTIDLELAEAKAEHARKVQKVERSVASNELDLHRIAKKHHAREVTHAQDGLEKLQITAPHAGIFVLERDWRGETVRVGDTVWRGQKLGELPLVAKMEAEVHVLEADAGNLTEGLPAEVVVEAHQGGTWAGKVVRVDTLAQPRHPEVPVNYFGVTLALDETDPERMRVGQRVQATIRVEQPEAIVVPRQAVFDVEGKTVVYRGRAEDFEPVEVKLGAASAGRVVIEQGLAPGDRIALRDPSKPTTELLSTDPDESSAAPVADPGGRP